MKRLKRALRAAASVRCLRETFEDLTSDFECKPRIGGLRAAPARAIYRCVVALQSTNLKACRRTGSILFLGYQPDCEATYATVLRDRDPTLDALHRCMARSRWGEEAECFGRLLGGRSAPASACWARCPLAAGCTQLYVRR